MLDLQEVTYRQEDAERMLGALDLDLSALAKPVRAFSKGMTQKLGSGRLPAEPQGPVRSR